MATSDDHERWADSVGAYLLRALPPEERDGFEAHLATCEACRRDAEALQVAVDALPASPRQYAAPPELKDRIMSVVRSEAQLLQAAGPQADVPVQPSRPERRWRFGWRPALALAGVLALGVVGGTLLRDGGGGEVAPRTVLADVEVEGAQVHLIVRDEHSTLVARDLPRPERGRVYQVWLKHRNRPAPQPTDALFTVDRDGSASVDVPGSLDEVEAVLVTSEPDGGSSSPTRQPIIAAGLA